MNTAIANRKQTAIFWVWERVRENIPKRLGPYDFDIFVFLYWLSIATIVSTIFSGGLAIRLYTRKDVGRNHISLAVANTACAMLMIVGTFLMFTKFHEYSTPLAEYYLIAWEYIANFFSIFDFHIYTPASLDEFNIAWDKVVAALFIWSGISFYINAKEAFKKGKTNKDSTGTSQYHSDDNWFYRVIGDPLHFFIAGGIFGGIIIHPYVTLLATVYVIGYWLELIVDNIWNFDDPSDDDENDNSGYASIS